MHNRGAAHSVCNLKFYLPKEISVVFHNGSNYDYHFIIKELANEFKGQLECLWEYTERKVSNFFHCNRKRSVKIDKDGYESVITISSKIIFIDSERFMAIHYQIWEIISQKEFIKLSVKIVIVFLNMKVSREIL